MSIEHNLDRFPSDHVLTLAVPPRLPLARGNWTRAWALRWERRGGVVELTYAATTADAWVVSLVFAVLAAGVGSWMLAGGIGAEGSRVVEIWIGWGLVGLGLAAPVASWALARRSIAAQRAEMPEDGVAARSEGGKVWVWAGGGRELCEVLEVRLRWGWVLNPVVAPRDLLHRRTRRAYVLVGKDAETGREAATTLMLGPPGLMGRSSFVCQAWAREAGVPEEQGEFGGE